MEGKRFQPQGTRSHTKEPEAETFVILRVLCGSLGFLLYGVPESKTGIETSPQCERGRPRPCGLHSPKPGQKRAAPFLGPQFKRGDRKETSGKAMQGAAPPAGTAQREMSRTESEGHSSAASFHTSAKKHLPGQNPCSQAIVMNITCGLVKSRTCNDFGLCRHPATKPVLGQRNEHSCTFAAGTGSLVEMRQPRPVTGYACELPATVRSLPGRK